MKGKAKTTATRKPTKNQQEKQTKETQNMKTKKSNMENRRNQTAQNESILDFRRGCQEICLKERSTNEDNKGPTKTEQNKKRERYLTRG